MLVAEGILSQEMGNWRCIAFARCLVPEGFGSMAGESGQQEVVVVERQQGSQPQTIRRSELVTLDRME